MLFANERLNFFPAPDGQIREQSGLFCGVYSRFTVRLRITAE